MKPYILEAIGTMIMILLLDGVMANVTLKKSIMRGGGSLQITLASGLAMLVPCLVVGTQSGTYFNSALTIALVIDGTLALRQALGYIAAQFVGAFVGAILVYINYKNQFDATEDPGSKLGVFSTGPAIPQLGRNIFNEALATFVLVMAIKGMGVCADAAAHKYLVAAVYIAIGMSLGGTTFYAMNPARDWAPRLAHAVLSIKGKGSSNWGYSIVPVLGPIVGAVAAVLLFGILPV